MTITPLPALGSPSWYTWAQDIDTAARTGGGGSTLAVAATVTASGALVTAKHNPVDATSGVKAMTLPTGAASGTLLGVEKTDAGANAVTVTGSIRGVGATTVSLVWQNEALLLAADTSGSWWPVAGHKTKTSLDAAYVPFKSLALNPDLLIAGTITRDSNGAATSAPVVWPDGSPGTYTATTVSTAFPGAVDAYTITYGSPVTKTYTQSTVTRDATTGAVTVRPALTVA